MNGACIGHVTVYACKERVQGELYSYLFRVLCVKAYLRQARTAGCNRYRITLADPAKLFSNVACHFWSSHAKRKANAKRHRFIGFIAFPVYLPHQAKVISLAMLLAIAYRTHFAARNRFRFCSGVARPLSCGVNCTIDNNVNKTCDRYISRVAYSTLLGVN